MNPLSLIVRVGCDLFAWFMLVFGTNVIIHGYMSPGGGFQGGAIAATFIVFLLVAWGSRRVHSWVNERIYDVLFEELGLLSFIILAFLGLPTSFFFNYLATPLGVASPWFTPGAGTIFFMSIAVGIEVTGALSLVILNMHRGIRLFSESPMEEELGHDR